jgi:hypothetical protein
MTMTTQQLDEADQRYVTRATAHVRDPMVLRRAQRFAPYVTELETARVMLAIERGTVLTRSRTGVWRGPVDSRLGHVSPAVNEMIRTGLLRDYRDPRTDQRSLIPARTHLDTGSGASACLFAGEDLGPMRARLVRTLDLVDCLECESAASGLNVSGL